MGFRFSFTPLPGFFSPFLHSTYSLSVIREYLGLGGGPPDFPQGFSCPVVLWILLSDFRFRLLDFHHLWFAFPIQFEYFPSITSAVLNPIPIAWFGLACFLFARHYLGNRVFFLLLLLLRCFSSQRFPSIAYFIQLWITELFSAGFPHSDIYGSQTVCVSP
jgi:hypothetical protein